jgi:CRISPR-associated protein Cas1
MKTHKDYSKFRERLPFMYLEYYKIDREQNNCVCHNENGSLTIPIANCAALMLGMGTSITHDAVCLAGETGTTLCFVGEEGTRFYAHGNGGTDKSTSLMRQMKCYASKRLRRNMIEVVYERILGETVSGLELNQIRGKEGARVRKAYKTLGDEYGVLWEGRKYDRKNISQQNPINSAITYANQFLYGIIHSALIAMGYSPAIGFIHRGFTIAFVCDIADLYKTGEIFPLCFQLIAESEKDVRKRIRRSMLEYIRKTKMMKRIEQDIQGVFHDCLNR